MKIIWMLPIMLLFCFTTYFPTGPRTLGAETTFDADGKYAFSEDWFTNHIPTWTGVLREMKGKPGLSYLEVGVYEGRSFLWVVDNILTHPSSKAVAIDTFDKFGPTDPEKVFRENVRRSGRTNNIEVIKGFSRRALRTLKPNSLDLIYIDGDHTSKSVLMDAILSWDLLKDGGILIFDDYNWDFALPTEMRPTFALDVFQALFRDDFQIIVKDYQLIIRKARTQCNEAMGSVKVEALTLTCSRLGPYTYYWKPRRLFETSTSRRVVLRDGETSRMENILMRRRLGFRLETDEKERDDYRNLLKRLGLKDIDVSTKNNTREIAD